VLTWFGTKCYQLSIIIPEGLTHHMTQHDAVHPDLVVHEHHIQD